MTKQPKTAVEIARRAVPENQEPVTMTSLVRRVTKHYASDAGTKPVEDGHRWRVTKVAKEIGKNVVEIGQSYFYSSLVKIDSTTEWFKLYAGDLGFNIELTPIDNLVVHSNKNPKKQPWATQHFLVEFK